MIKEFFENKIKNLSPTDLRLVNHYYTIDLEDTPLVIERRKIIKEEIQRRINKLKIQTNG